MTKPAITLNGIGINKEQWTKSTVEGILQEMAKETKAEFKRLYQSGISDEEAEDKATD